MIGAYADYSGVFLRVLAVLTGLLAVPIALAPLAWARTFRWTVGEQPELALYFGRCLGAFAVTICVATWYVAGHDELQPFFFTVVIALLGSMTLVHVVGAVQRVQPSTETAEIAFWFLLLAGALLCYPALEGTAEADADGARRRAVDGGVPVEVAFGIGLPDAGDLSVHVDVLFRGGKFLVGAVIAPEIGPPGPALDA